MQCHSIFHSTPVGEDMGAVLSASPVVGFPIVPILEVSRGPICPGEASLVAHHADPGAVHIHGDHPGCQKVRLGLGVDTGQVSIVSVRSQLEQTGASSFNPGDRSPEEEFVAIYSSKILPSIWTVPRRQHETTRQLL